MNFFLIFFWGSRETNIEMALYRWHSILVAYIAYNQSNLSSQPRENEKQIIIKNHKYYPSYHTNPRVRPKEKRKKKEEEGGKSVSTSQTPQLYLVAG